MWGRLWGHSTCLVLGILHSLLNYGGAVDRNLLAEVEEVLRLIFLRYDEVCGKRLLTDYLSDLSFLSKLNRLRR